MKTILAIIAACAFLAALYAFKVQNPILPAPTPLVPFPDGLVGLGGSHNCANAIALHFRQSVAFDSGDEGIDVKWNESDSANPTQWYPSEVYESTTYRVTACRGRVGGSVLYVAGVSPDGSDVIERLNYGTRSGGYGIQITSGSALPIGTPMSSYVAQEFLNGAPFTPPGTQHGPARRTVIYTGNAIGHVRAMDVDPEGRFLLLLSYGSANLYEIDLSAQTSTPVVLYTVAQIPHLAKAQTLEIRHHIGEGRKVILSELSGCSYPSDYSWTVLNDANNDGVFESWATLDDTSWTAAGYDQWANWKSYQNVGVAYNW